MCIRDRENIVEVEMPVGLYTDFKVSPPCGLCSKHKIIGFLDTPSSFHEPGRGMASLIWFERGFVEYKFPNNVPANRELEKIEISMELCSEALDIDENWPSDITVWINGIEVGTWISPRDFTGKRGKLTPQWWKVAASQYGLLKRWSVTKTGSLVDCSYLFEVQDVGLKSSKGGGNSYFKDTDPQTISHYRWS